MVEKRVSLDIDGPTKGPTETKIIRELSEKGIIQACTSVKELHDVIEEAFARYNLNTKSTRTMLARLENWHKGFIAAWKYIYNKFCRGAGDGLDD